MDINEALKVAGEFQKYLKSGDDAAINNYSKTYIQSALVSILSDDRNKLWYKAMEKRITELDELEKEKRQEAKRLKDKKWWHDPLFINISSGIAGAVIGGIITGAISMYIFRMEHRERNKEKSPVEVIIKDKKEIERDRLRAEIKDAVNSGDTSKIMSVFDDLNRQK